MSTERGNFRCLKNIPEHLLLNVVSKLPSKERIAMRKTCRDVNNFVEDNRQVLARTFLEGGISLLLTTYNGKVHFHSKSGIFLCYLYEENPVDDETEKKISGLAIKHVDVLDDMSLDFEKIVSSVKKLNLFTISAAFHMHRTPRTPQEQIALTEFIEFTDHYWCRCEMDLREYLKIVQQSPYLSKLSIFADCSNRAADPAIVEMMKHFHSFNFVVNRGNTSFFNGVVWGLNNARDCSLKSVDFTFNGPRNWNIFDLMRYPHMNILWNEENIEYTSSKYRSIRLLRAEERSVVILEEKKTQDIHMKFFDREDEAGILDLLVESLDLNSKFTDGKRKEYLDNDNEKRLEIIKTIFTDKWHNWWGDEQRRLQEKARAAGSK